MVFPNSQPFWIVVYRRTMTSLAKKLRSSKHSSTDPDWQEKMASYYDTPMEPLNAWMFEVENYSLRYERMISEIGNNPLEVLKWLKTAYEIGYESGNYNNVPEEQN